MKRRHSALLACLCIAALSGCVTTNPYRTFVEADAAYRVGDYDRAIAGFSALIESTPDERSKGAYFAMRGSAYRAKGELDKALADADTAVRFRPDMPLAYSIRAAINMTRAQYELAISDLDVAIKLNPSTSLYSNRGFARIRAGDSTRAMEDFDAAIRMKGTNEEAYFGRGEVYFERADFTATIHEMGIAIRLNPELWSAYNMRGTAYMLTGDLDRAILDQEAAVLFQPRHAAPVGNRGIAHYLKGNFHEAAKDLKRTLDLEPNAAVYVLHLHYARQKLGIDDSAEFAANAAKLDMTAWPNQLVAFHRGSMSLEQLNVLTSGFRADAKNVVACQVSYVLGRKKLMAGDVKNGQADLRIAATRCGPRQVERILAKAALQ